MPGPGPAPRRILVVQTGSAPADPVLLRVLTRLGHQVSSAALTRRAVQDGTHHLRAAATSSGWRRPLLAVVDHLTPTRRRARYAARFDPWFRARVREADTVLLLGPAGGDVGEVATAFDATTQQHRGEETLREQAQHLLERTVEDLLDRTGTRSRTRFEDDLYETLTSTLGPLQDLAQDGGVGPLLPGLIRERLRSLPGLTQDPGQSMRLARMLMDLLGREDPVLAAWVARRELDTTGRTTSDPAAVAARLLEDSEPLLAVPPEPSPGTPGLPELADRVALALSVLFHRELHSDRPDAPLFVAPRDFLAPVRATRVWQHLTGPQPAPRHGPDELTSTAGPRTGEVEGMDVPTRMNVLVLPGAYGTFHVGLRTALQVLPAAAIGHLRRSELPSHLRTMGLTPGIVQQRLAAQLGRPMGGYATLREALTEEPPDVLVVDWADKTAVLATLIAPRTTRIVLRVHGVDALRPWIHLLDWSRVDTLVAVSEHLLALVRDVVGERAQRVPARVIPNLVDLDAPVDHRTRDPLILCLIGWAQRVKDPVWALEVLSRLRQDGRDWRLLLVGADLDPSAGASATEHAAAFRERAMVDDVREHLEFTGFLQDLGPVHARTGFVLSTSLRESYPVGLVEGILGGAVPVVRNWPMMASRGGAANIYDQEWVVEDVDGAVELIRSLADPAQRDAAADRARSQVVEQLRDATGALRDVVLGDLGRLAQLTEEHRHDEAVQVVREALDRPTTPVPVLQQAVVTTTRAGEPSLRLAALRRWAEVDPRPHVASLLRQHEGRMRELTPGWLPGDLPVTPVDPVPGRVLHVLKVSLPHRQSGYAMRSYYLLREQARAGVDVLAVTALDFPGQRTPDVEVVGEVPHLRLLRAGPPEGEPLDEYQHRFAHELHDLVRAHRPAVLHAHSGHHGYDMVQVAQAVGRATGIPVVYEVRGFFESVWTKDVARAEEAELYRLRRDLESHFMATADAVVTLSESMREDILLRTAPDGARIDPDRVFVVPNGVDVAGITPRPTRADLVDKLGLRGSFVYGYVSNLDHHREGQELLIEALRPLRDRGVPAKALIVGDGTRREELEQLTQRRGLGEHVVFTGSVPHAQVGDYYALLDVFVVPRIDERAARLVTPLKPYEAMAMELPVVVSDLPALAEIIGDGDRGLSFPVGDTEALARVLAGLAQDPERRRRLGRTGRQWVEQERTWGRLAARYADVYSSVRST